MTNDDQRTPENSVAELVAEHGEREAYTRIVAHSIRLRLTEEKLLEALTELVEWLDKTDRTGCAHTEHARKVIAEATSDE